MQWISVTERLPAPFQVVWIYWRDKEVLLGCRVNAEGSEPHENWYSFEDVKCRWTHWWMPVTEASYD